MPVPWFFWPLLVPLAALYAPLVRLRLLLYRMGWKRTHRLGRPTVSVGNLTAGGAGKTPVVSWLLGATAALGLSAACLSRGYGRRTQATLSRVRAADGTPLDPVALGDEAALLAVLHPAVPLFVGADRVAAARLALLTDAPHLFVLDDGYQHLRAARDVNVLLVDAQAGFGNGRLLPLGPLREPMREVRRADVVLITKANLGDADAIAARLRARGVTVPVFRCDYRATELVRLDAWRAGTPALPVAEPTASPIARPAAEPAAGPTAPPATPPTAQPAALLPQALAGRRVGLLCGIAQPEALRATVASLGADVAQVEARPDHHAYPEADLLRLGRLLADGPRGAPASDGPDWITTEKDAVKLRGRLGAPERLWVLAMAAEPEPAAREFFLERLRVLCLSPG